MAKGKSKKAEKPKEDEGKLAEMRRQQQVAAKAELRQRMEDEVRNSKVNNLKILNQWRKIMRLAKTESLKKDIEILSQNHERDVDRKDAILQMLDRDLEEAEDQYQMALRTHLSNVDALIKLHDSRLYALERSFHQELKKVEDDFAKEKESMLAKFRHEKRMLSSIIDAIEKEEEDRENDTKHAFEQLREEIRNRNLEDINMLRISLDAQIEELEQQFETAHLNYLQQTAQRTHDFKELTQNDQRLSLDIDQRRKKIDSLQSSIQNWRAKIRQLNRETEERNRLLREEKNSIQHHYQQLKQRIQVYRGSQNQRLLHLSQSANSCKEALREKLELARRVLQLSELSRRMETISEQVLPFANDGANEENSPNDDANALGGRQRGSSDAFAGLEDQAQNHSTAMRSQSRSSSNFPAHQSSLWSREDQLPVSYADRLANFHRKYNKALLDNIAISKEKERLLAENAQIEDLIQQFVAGTKVSDEVLKGDNPLFVVNGRANLNHVPVVRKDKNTVVQEATVIQSTIARQITRG